MKNNVEIFIKRYGLVIVVLLFSLALRVYPNLDQLVFPYDQSRDVFVLKQAWEQKNPMLLGPVTDLPGIYHGPLYYYFIIFWYVLGNWQPQLPVLALILSQLLGIGFLYYSLQKMFNKNIALIAIVLSAFSYELIAYSRWLSNPVLAIPLFPIFLYVFWEIIEHKKPWGIFLGISLGLMIQSEVVLGYLLFLVLIYFWREKISIKQYCLLFIGMVSVLSTFIIAELKFKGQTLLAITNFISNKESQQFSVLQITESVASIWGKIFYNNIFAVGNKFSLVFLLFFLIVIIHFSRERYQRKVRFLVTFFCSSFILFLFGHQVSIFFLAGYGMILISLFAVFIEQQWLAGRKVFAVILMIVAISSQLKTLYVATRDHTAYVFIQRDVLLDQRLTVVKHLYENSQGQPFSISVFGTPYGIRTSWSYYFWIYQQRNGGNIPSWFGFTANGYAGDEVFSLTDHPNTNHFVIYEPSFDIDEMTKNTFRETQDNASQLVNKTEIQGHVIEQRKPKE